MSLISLAGLPVSAEPQVTVFRVQALNASGVREGTCFVIRQEQRAEGTFLALVTSARLFDRETGRRAKIFLDGEKPVEITQEAISTPYDNMRDIAVLEAVVQVPPPSTLPVVFEAVLPGTPFFVAGVRPDGSRALVAQHVRFCATRTVVGDGSTEMLVGCQGAPAIIEGGVFGIVSECGPDRVPEITPLAVSRNFLLRAVPALSEAAPGLSNSQPKSDIRFANYPDATLLAPPGRRR